MPEDKPKGSQYIPLAKIADLTPYSEGHLILLARRGKLKTIKQDETYYTTLEWVDDYLMWLDEKLEFVRGNEQAIGEAQVEPVVQQPAVASEPANETSSSELQNFGISEPVIPIQSVLTEPPIRPGRTEIPHDRLLSMVEAEKHCAYSAAYLALRVRQGKLQGQKIGRNWFTKLDWINEYVAAHGAKESNE